MSEADVEKPQPTSSRTRGDRSYFSHFFGRGNRNEREGCAGDDEELGQGAGFLQRMGEGRAFQGPRSRDTRDDSASSAKGINDDGCTTSDGEGSQGMIDSARLEMKKQKQKAEMLRRQKTFRSLG